MMRKARWGWIVVVGGLVWLPGCAAQQSAIEPDARGAELEAATYAGVIPAQAVRVFGWS